MMHQKNELCFTGRTAEPFFRKWLRLMTVAVLCAALFLPAVTTAQATTRRGAYTLEVYQGKNQTAKPFHTVNMFPGDRVSETYMVEVSYIGKINLRFHADIHKGYEKLAEVLKCSVTIDGKLEYDGLMKDMPAQVSHWMDASAKITEVVPYKIDVYLDTSVGNPYMNKELKADFRWWVEEKENLTENPKTGDDAQWLLFTGVAAGSMFLLILLIWKRRKGECGNGAE